MWPKSTAPAGTAPRTQEMSPLLDGRLFVALGGDRESPNKAFDTNNEFAATVVVGSSDCVYVRCAISVVRQQRQFGMETIRVQEPIGSHPVCDHPIEAF
jgi:hypothetical protein